MNKTVIASVIMTVYNGEAFLSAAIESIKKQTLTELEFVIVNDGSTDTTANILANAKSDPRIKVISSKRLGRARALNLAWHNTTGKFIGNLDADDLAESDRIEKQVHYLQANPSVGLLGSAWNFFVDNDPQRVKVFHPPLSSSELKSALIRRYPFCHSSTMVTRHALEQVSGYNEHYQVCIDYEMATRIACRYEVANLPEVLAWKRSHLSSCFSQISAWERYKAVVKIRWMAWATFSRKIHELPHVMNGWGILRQSIGRGIYGLRSQFIELGTMPK